MSTPERTKPGPERKHLDGWTTAEVEALIAENARLLALPPKKPTGAAAGRAAELEAQRRRAAAGKPSAAAAKLKQQTERLAAILGPRRR